MVTGAEGMLGRDLVPALSTRHDVVAVDLDVDVTDKEAIAASVLRHRPDAVFHLAAWTNVDGAEAHEADALAVNGTGTGNVAHAAAAIGAPLIVVSTDYVFDGTSTVAYSEDDPVAPINAYGRSKLAGERAALAAHPTGTRIARTAWLYGAHGRNFVDTMRRLGATQDSVSVVDDQFGSPTWTRELVPALIALLDCAPGIYHTACAGFTTWAGLARAVFEEAGLECHVHTIPTTASDRPARRPARSVLATTRPGAPRLRPWRDALHDYIRENPAP